MKCLKCSSSFWEIGQKASIFIIKLLSRIFSNEYMQGKPNSFKTGLKTTLKFNIRLGSSVLTYPDCPCKNGNMWPYDWKKSQKICVSFDCHQICLQEVESWTQSQGQFQFPAVDMLHATIFWKLTKMEGNAVKNLWQLRPSGDTFGDKFRPKMYLTMNLNKCKIRGKNRFITVAFSSPWVYSATHLHELRWNAS